MELFELVPDESYDGHIEASHKWGLPGVKCDVCGATWANVGIAYPTADLSKLPNPERYAKGWPVSWSEFEEARKSVLPLLPQGAPAPPGTGLGPLVGDARGAFPDVAWQNPWTMLVRSTVLDPLRAKGIGPLPGGMALLNGRHGSPELIELQLEPRGRMSPESIPPTPPCVQCGRQAITRPSQVVVQRASIPTDHSVFRLADLTTMVIGTDRAVDALTALGLQGFRFQTVTLG